MTTENANRIATALERIADALERIPTITVGEIELAACDDRTCTDRDHWAPIGHVEHGGSAICVHGQDHPDSLTCEYRCAATMPGHWCTRTEHGDDRIPWTTAGDLAALLAMVEPDSPVYVVMSERYGTFDHIQIGGAR